MKKLLAVLLVFILLAFCTSCSSASETLDLSHIAPADCASQAEGYVFPDLSWAGTPDAVKETFSIQALSLFEEESELGEDLNSDGKILQSTGSTDATLFGQNGTLTFTFLENALYMVQFDIETGDPVAVLNDLSAKLSGALGEADDIQTDSNDVARYYLWSTSGSQYSNTLINLFASETNNTDAPVADACTVSLIWNRSLD